MQLVFINESGFTPDWRTGVSDQPFYVASAVWARYSTVHCWSEILRVRWDQWKGFPTARPVRL